MQSLDQSLFQSAAQSEPKWGRRARVLSLLAAAVLLLAGAAYTLPRSSFNFAVRSQDYGNLLTDVVIRGPFVITVTDDGYLDSRRNAVLASKVEGTTTIISILPEGTIVEEGDVICELDSAEFREDAKQQEITLTQAKSAFAQATENIEIQRTQNDSDIAAASLQAELAALDLNKYKDGLYTQQKNEIEGEIRLKQEELTRAKENYKFSKNMAKKGYRNQNEVEADRLGVTKSEIELSVAEEKLKVLENYEKERTMRELLANEAEFKRELDRVKRKSRATMSQVEAEEQAARLTAEVEQDKYNHLLEQIEACTIAAPQAGQVVYSSDSSRRSSEPTPIEEGTTIRERQRIINLPDLTQMKVDARIHESAISRIQVGLAVLIRMDAVPGEIYHGEVTNISSVPMSGSWPNYDLKEYEAEINITDEVEKISRLKPGMTAQLEIIVKRRESVLQVPVQAVVSVGPRRFMYVLRANGPERQDVQVGETNDRFIEILQGAQEMERVVLNPRTSFANEISELQGDLSADQTDTSQPTEPPADESPTSPTGNDSATGTSPGTGGETVPAFDPRTTLLSPSQDGTAGSISGVLSGTATVAPGVVDGGKRG